MIRPNKIIVVGGNAAGPAAAARAKRVNPNSEVILFEAGNFISTGTCEIPYVLSDDIKDHSEIIFFSPESFFRKKGVKVFINHSVEEIDTKENEISVRNGDKNKSVTFNYDTLILCTGSTARILPQFNAELNNVFTLKNVSDLIGIKNYINKNNVSKAVIIGSGYIGLEAAEAISKIGIKVTLLEKEDQPMPTGEPELKQEILSLCKNNEIGFIGSIDDIEPVIYDGVVKSIKLGDDYIDTDLIILSVGFSPNTFLAQQAKLELGRFGGIKVDKKLTTSNSRIFAAGDNCEVVNAVTGKPDYIPLATTAYTNGHIAGENAAGGNLSSEPVVKNAAVKFFDQYFAFVGLTSNEAETARIKFNSVTVKVPNIVKVMPGSREVFGKLIFEKSNQRILGASFYGGTEVSGYADLVSSLIKLKQDAEALTKINYNYTPPLSPFINPLYLLGKKAKAV
jgi:NADPH-dependent 2,4-dienoyl-CoA reductase/sulfur reductase-like enzyme